MHKIASFKH